MGLDQFLSGRKYLWTGTRQEDGHRVKSIDIELGYWRKHPNLHGFIVQAFADGNDDCRDVELDVTAIKCVLSAIKEDRLPVTTGFFFGHSDGSEKEQDIKVFEQALAWLESAPGGKQTTMSEGLPFDGVGVLYEVKLPEADEAASELRTIVYRASW